MPTIVTWPGLIDLRHKIESRWLEPNKRAPVISGGPRSGMTTLTIDLAAQYGPATILCHDHRAARTFDDCYIDLVDPASEWTTYCSTAALFWVTNHFDHPGLVVISEPCWWPDNLARLLYDQMWYEGYARTKLLVIGTHGPYANQFDDAEQWNFASHELSPIFTGRQLGDPPPSPSP